MPLFVILESNQRLNNTLLHEDQSPFKYHIRAQTAAVKGIYLHLGAARLLEGQIHLVPFTVTKYNF